MNRRLVIVLIALFLTACAGRTVKDDSPASDLIVAQQNMHRTLAPRALANGKTYCAEDARTEDEQDDCLGDMEALAYKSERDKANGLVLFDRLIERLTLQRNPCGFWARTFRRARCEVK